MDAPKLPDDLPWIGAPGRPVLGDGRVGVVLFWSATSVHCERALAVLSWLEVRFVSRPLVIASVHVPRHERERGVDFVRRACARLGVRHAVAVDDDGAAARAWQVERLPTLAVVDARGELRFRGAGEPDRARLTAALDALLAAAAAVPPPTVAAAWPPPLPRGRTALRGPSGVAVDVEAGLLWIADTGRHRVVAVGCDDGVLRHVVGTGRPGASDGDFADATFASPRGLCVDRGSCYVADTGNHLIRRIDPDGAQVVTVLGQGRLVADRAGGLAAADQGIAAPWDVEVVGDDLYVAMAGVHQIWHMSIGDGYASPWSGSGDPGDADGMRHDARFAQPAALAHGCDELAVADSDNGAVRIAGLSTQHVHTLHGGSAGGDPLAQPRGVAWHHGELLVADALHGRVVCIRPRDGSFDTIATGLGGPEGLAVAGDRLFVADPAADRIVVVDLTDGTAEDLAVVDPHPDHVEPAPPPLRLRASASVALQFPLQIPVDERVHPDVRGRVLVEATDGDVLVRPHSGFVAVDGTWGAVRGLETGPAGAGGIRIAVRYATCTEPTAEPHVQELSADLRVELGPDGPERAELHIG